MGLPIILGIAQTGLGIYSQQQSAKAQAKYQQAASKAEAQRARQQMSAERIQQSFQREERARELQQASRKAQEARARAKVAAGEAGVAGVSVDALINDFNRQEAVFRFGLQRQGEQIDVARELRFKDMGLQSYNTQIGINQPIPQPDYAGAIFGGVQTGLAVYNAKQK